ncbi:Coenzyme F420 hydrogenase/dehydrogenase, beta subunit C-terminal domain [Planktomarina temperata]|nr:Coenzyme F420 hydrogenase/dehydrogenase, beta subunit C-terminal domain [Planktomarina temperata]
MHCKDVMESDVCINCGACATISDKISFDFINDTGFFEPRLAGLPSHHEWGKLDQVCPQSSSSRNENSLANEKFTALTKKKKYVGHYLSNYAGHVNSSERLKSSSGGLLSFTLKQMLESSIIDAAIVCARSENSSLYEFQFIKTTDDIAASRGSHYYHTDFTVALKLIEETELTLTLVGLPCQLKTFANLQAIYPDKYSNVKFVLSVVCGHMKSSFFSEYIAAHGDINPDELSQINFRQKEVGKYANNYSYKVRNKDGINKTIYQKDVYASNWGFNLFRMPGCFYCDDVLGEVADATFGDAWIPPYIEDYQGTNICIVRDRRIDELLLTASENHLIQLDKIHVDDVIESQMSGIKDRNRLLQQRLRDRIEKFKIAPKKRVKPRIIRNKNLRLRSRAQHAIAHSSIKAWSNSKTLDDFVDLINDDKIIIDRINASLKRSNFTEFFVRNVLSPRRGYRKLRQLIKEILR